MKLFRRNKDCLHGILPVLVCCIDSCVPVAGLEKDTDRLMNQALATSTNRIYDKHVLMFKTFCSQLRIDISKGFTSKAVELWLTNLQKQNMAYSTVRARLSALRHYCIRKEILSELETPRIKLILKGIKKGEKKKNRKPLVTISHLKRLIMSSEKVLSKKKHSRFIAMIAIAFFGFLRPSEYCVSPVGHELQWNDVKFSKKFVSMRLALSSFKHSKKRAKVQLFSMRKDYCPVELMKKYRENYRNSHGLALFSVTQKQFGTTLRNLCAYANIKSKLTPHCFRHGGASWAERQGWSDAQIRTHGRWMSDAFKLYVRAF